MTKKKRPDSLDNAVIIIRDKDNRLGRNEAWGGGKLMLADKRQKVLASDAPMAAWRAISGKQILVDPIDNRPRIHVKEPADLVCCVNRFVRHLGLARHADNHR